MTGKEQRPHRRYEGLWRRRGFSRVAGVDEVGRGCLAGPVVAVALVLPAKPPDRIRDSKRLTPQRRLELYQALREAGTSYAWGAAEPAEIDRHNILQATFLAMRRAVSNLWPPPEALLIDGVPIPDCPLPQRGLIRGDGRCLSIAAASIVAKVLRDQWMEEMAERYPIYGFERHKGYPTAQHREALRQHGPSPLHRLSFAPVRAVAGGSRFGAGCR
jgi:ribonuclease HII